MKRASSTSYNYKSGSIVSNLAKLNIRTRPSSVGPSDKDNRISTAGHVSRQSLFNNLMAANPPRSVPSSQRGKLNKGEYVKDLRGLSEKPNKDKAIREILDFIAKYNLQDSVNLNAKKLQSPSNSDFQRILEVMLDMLDYPRSKMHGKLEVFVPEVLNIYRYPYSVNPNWLRSVGTQHTYPHLLGILIFFKDLVEIKKETEDNYDDIFTEENMLLLEFNSRTYHDFLHLKEDFEDDYKLFEKKLLKDSNLEDEVNQLQLSVIEKRKIFEKLKEKNVKDSSIDKDIEKANERISKMKEKVDSLTESLKQKQDLLKFSENECDVLEKAYEQLKATLLEEEGKLAEQTKQGIDGALLSKETLDKKQEIEDLTNMIAKQAAKAKQMDIEYNDMLSQVVKDFKVARVAMLNLKFLDTNQRNYFMDCQCDLTDQINFHKRMEEFNYTIERVNKRYHEMVGKEEEKSEDIRDFESLIASVEAKEREIELTKMLLEEEDKKFLEMTEINEIELKKIQSEIRETENILKDKDIQIEIITTGNKELEKEIELLIEEGERKKKIKYDMCEDSFNRWMFLNEFSMDLTKSYAEKWKEYQDKFLQLLDK